MEINTTTKTAVSHKVLFTVWSGNKFRLGTEIESDTIKENQLEPWMKDCVLHHTGKKVSDREWDLFKKNQRLIRYDGDVKYTFEFSRYSVQ